MIIQGADGRSRDIRLTAQRKTRLVLDLLAGKTIDEVAREAGVDAVDLLAWRQRFVRAGTEGLKGTRTMPGQGAT